MCTESNDIGTPDGAAAETVCAGQVDTAKPKRSKAAMLGVVLAVVFLLPWVAPVFFRLGGFAQIEVGAKIGVGGALLAVLLGVVGVLQTARGIRRGRGLAIAAILLGFVGCLLQYASGSSVQRIAGSWARDVGWTAASVLSTKPEDTSANAQRWLDETASASFRASVTHPAMTKWLIDTAKKHGALLHLNAIHKAPKTVGRGMVVRYTGTFAAGDVAIEVVVIAEGGRAKLRVDDIRVGDSSPLK